MLHHAGYASNPLDTLLDASLQDFEAPAQGISSTPPPVFGYPSAHSGFRSSDGSGSETGTRNNNGLGAAAGGAGLLGESGGGYSPPAWRRLGNGDRSSGFWRRPESSTGIAGGFKRESPSGFGGIRSRRSSPFDYESADDDDDDNEAVLRAAMRTRLPTGSLSPEKEDPTATRMDVDNMIAEQLEEAKPEQDAEAEEAKPSENYIRFAVRAEVQQRTEPIEAVIVFARERLAFATRSWTSLTCSLLALLLSVVATRSLFAPAAQRPLPDLLKVAGVARSFEPLIYYSENSVSQVGDLQATGVAVWDLGESVRHSNMTSAPIIVKELDDLSESLKTLAIELTKFFANVDGDIDG